MKKKIVVGVCIVLFVAITAGATLYRNSKPAYKSLKGAQVSKGNIAEEVFASGRLELSDKTEVNTPFQAKIKAVNVKLGDQVQAGQALLELDTEDLSKQIDSAKLTVVDAKASLESAKLSRSYALEDAEKVMDDAYSTLSRVKAGESIPTPGGTLKEADAQAAYDTAKKTYDRMVNNPTSITSLENALKRANANLKDLQDQLGSAVVKAPVAGTVVALNAAVGSGDSGGGTSLSSAGLAGITSSAAGSAGNSLVTLANMDKLRARVKVNELDSTKIKSGQKVKITSDAVEKEFAGTVENISPIAVTTAGARGEETTVEVTVLLDTSSGLKPGYNVNAAVTTQESNSILVVPAEALTERQNKKVVFVVENGETKQREVSLGLSNDTQSEVKSGLNEGEKVVLTPALTLKEGDKVKVDE